MSLSCPRLEVVDLDTLSNSPLMLKRISVASSHLTHLCWRGVTSLEHVVLVAQEQPERFVETKLSFLARLSVGLLDFIPI